MNLADNIIWLFDYDLTLYTSEERYVLDSLDKRITEFVQELLSVDFEKASQIRQKYLQEFGTTLSGLQVKHGTSPNDFFDFIHQPEYLIYPPLSVEKKSILENLPGKKIVFTNGRADWASAGLKAMGIFSCFEYIFDLKAMDWIGKPVASAYDKMQNFLKLHFKENDLTKIVFLDDASRNLPMAKSKGWFTILVGETLSNEFTNFSLESILDLPAILPDLMERLHV